MSTILEALQNAEMNLCGNSSFPTPLQTTIGREQLKNAVALLNKDYTLYTDIDELIGEYDSIEDVPHNDSRA